MITSQTTTYNLSNTFSEKKTDMEQQESAEKAKRGRPAKQNPYGIIPMESYVMKLIEEETKKIINTEKYLECIDVYRRIYNPTIEGDLRNEFECKGVRFAIVNVGDLVMLVPYEHKPVIRQSKKYAFGFVMRNPENPTELQFSMLYKGLSVASTRFQAIELYKKIQGSMPSAVVFACKKK